MSQESSRLDLWFQSFLVSMILMFLNNDKRHTLSSITLSQGKDTFKVSRLGQETSPSNHQHLSPIIT